MRSPAPGPLALALLAAPFYLNDVTNLVVTDWRWWLFVDYVLVKGPPLLLVAWMLHSGTLAPGEIGLRRQAPGPAVLAVAVLALAAVLVDQNAYRLLVGWPGYGPLGGMPAIASPVWSWLDLTLGLALVGLTEELVFRACAARFLRDHLPGPVPLVAVSSVAFGLIHWSNGLHAVLITAVIGAVLMVGYLRTRSLAVVATAHFLVNFVDFAGVVPKSVFQLGG